MLLMGELLATVTGLFMATAGVVEGRRLRAARARVPIRIHVNGTRGKSGVTRLIAAGLRQSGMTTLGKVTGTSARWLLPDGAEVPVQRNRGRVRIHEQVRAVHKAAHLQCRALVAECMALGPELQHASEHLILQSTIGVVTNARLDHGDVMGWGRTAVARTLSNTVPVQGTLVCGDEHVFSALQAVAQARGTRILLADLPARAAVSDRLGAHPRQNLAVAATVLSSLGIDPLAALQGPASTVADPGAARWTVAAAGQAAAGQEVGAQTGTDDRMEAGEPVMILDALAANDPESLTMLMGAAVGSWVPGRVQIIYHHRADRDERTVPFFRLFRQWAREGIRWPRSGCSSPLHGLWTSGALLPRWTLKSVGASFGGSPENPGVVIREQVGLRPAVDRSAPPRQHNRGTLLVACGNTKGAMAWQQDFPGWTPVVLGAEPAADRGSERYLQAGGDDVP